jgi:hypothetical protein
MDGAGHKVSQNLRVLDGGQPVLVVKLRLGITAVHLVGGVNELLDGDVSVSTLTIEGAILCGRVLHVESVVGTEDQQGSAEEPVEQRHTGCKRSCLDHQL